MGSERHDDNSYPYSAEVKNEWSYNTAPPIRLHGVDRVNYKLHVGYFNTSVNVCKVERKRRRPCICVGKELVMSSDDSEKGADSLSCAAQPYCRTDPFRSAEISVTTRE